MCLLTMDCCRTLSSAVADPTVSQSLCCLSLWKRQKSSRSVLLKGSTFVFPPQPPHVASPLQLFPHPCPAQLAPRQGELGRGGPSGAAAECGRVVPLCGLLSLPPPHPKGPPPSLAPPPGAGSPAGLVWQPLTVQHLPGPAGLHVLRPTLPTIPH